MSQVTDVIIVAGLEEEKAFDEINQWLFKECNQILKDATHCFGGNKYAQLSCYGGAINHLGKIEEFLRIVKVVSWDEKNLVTIIIHEEESKNIEIYKLT